MCCLAAPAGHVQIYSLEKQHRLDGHFKKKKPDLAFYSLLEVLFGELTTVSKGFRVIGSQQKLPTKVKVNIDSKLIF